MVVNLQQFRYSRSLSSSIRRADTNLRSNWFGNDGGLLWSFFGLLSNISSSFLQFYEIEYCQD